MTIQINEVTNSDAKDHTASVRTITTSLSTGIQVHCDSASRDCTSYTVVDQFGDKMGGRTFSCGAFEGPIAFRFNKALCDDLNVLLEEFDIELSYDEFRDISNSAINACERKYGYSRCEGPDCIITL